MRSTFNICTGFDISICAALASILEVQTNVLAHIAGQVTRQSYTLSSGESNWRTFCLCLPQVKMIFL